MDFDNIMAGLTAMLADIVKYGSQDEVIGVGGLVAAVLVVAWLMRVRHRQKRANKSVLPKVQKSSTGNTAENTLDIPRMDDEAANMGAPLADAQWLKRGETAQASPQKLPDDMVAKPIDAAATRLAEIERQMLALRDLYEAGLIAPEVYLVKSREIAAQSALIL